MNDRDPDSELSAVDPVTTEESRGVIPAGRPDQTTIEIAGLDRRSRLATAGVDSTSRPSRDPVGSRTTFVGALAALAIALMAVTLLAFDGTTQEAARVQAPAGRMVEEQEPCNASARTRGRAVAAYERSCTEPRVDCDPVDGGWLCSSEPIGAASPAGPSGPTSPRPTTTIAEPPPTSHPPTAPPVSGEQANEFACLEGATSVKALTGLQDGVTWFRDLPSGAAVDLRQAFFESITPDGDNWYPLQVRSPSGRDVCLAGGTVTGTRPLDISWNYTYQHRQNHAGVRVETPGAAVHGMHIYNTWDGVRVLEHDWEIAHTWLEYIRDDCIENDSIQSGRVYDSLFDGCFVGHSNRPGRRDSRSSGAGKTVTFEKSLFRMEPMPYPNVGVNYPNLLDVDGVPYGHAGFLKGARTKDPTYVVKDSIFLFQWNPRDGVLDLDKIDECSNNTVVWLGPGPFPGRLPPGCFTVTTDINVWKDAVRDWHARHPNVGENRKKPVNQQGDIWTYFPRGE